VEIYKSFFVNKGVRILVAGYDKASLLMFNDTFGKSGFEVITSTSGEETIKKAIKFMPQIILMDIILHGKDGIETCAELRILKKLKESIIVFYTNRNEDYSQIAAFNAGADDYVIKPVRPNVFRSRINALLKRFHQYNEIQSVKKTIGISIDRERYIVYRDGDEVTLPRKEFELLALLNSSPGKVFTREEISRIVWGYDTQAHNRTIDVHIRKLRQKLGKHFIKTVKGVGYSILS
jgi:two-component system alkaline phosphatase synthesis response regulator PhoP